MSVLRCVHTFVCVCVFNSSIVGDDTKTHDHNKEPITHILHNALGYCLVMALKTCIVVGRGRHNYMYHRRSSCQ